MKITNSGNFHLPNELTKIVLAIEKMYVEILNYGAIIYGIYLPLKVGGFENVGTNKLGLFMVNKIFMRPPCV